MRKQRPPLRIVGERVLSRTDPNKVLGTRPEDFPDLLAACQAAWATMQTGVVHVPKKAAGS